MSESNADRLLSGYLLWGIVSICTFIIFVVLLLVAVVFEKTSLTLYFMVLLAGFLWIGVTSISRHVFVMLKRHLEKDISVFEFLSTQFIVLLFPFFYMKLKKEISLFKGKK
jgi:hypothetical protein